MFLMTTFEPTFFRRTRFIIENHLLPICEIRVGWYFQVNGNINIFAFYMVKMGYTTDQMTILETLIVRGMHMKRRNSWKFFIII